mgnify:CR=1 FL=1
MRTHLNTELLVSEWCEDTTQPFLCEVDSSAKWWQLLSALWTHIASGPLHRDPSNKNRIVHCANMDVNIYLPIVREDFNTYSEKLLRIELTERQRELISWSDRDLILITSGGTTSIIADPGQRVVDTDGTRTWVHKLPVPVATDILRLLCNIGDGITHRMADRTSVVVADLTLSHIFISGSVGPRVFRLLCDRASCPTQLGTTFTTDLDFSKPVR